MFKQKLIHLMGEIKYLLRGSWEILDVLEVYGILTVWDGLKVPSNLPKKKPAQNQPKTQLKASRKKVKPNEFQNIVINRHQKKREIELEFENMETDCSVFFPNRNRLLMKNYFEENQFLLVRFCVVSCCCVLYGRKIQLNFIKFSGIIKMEVMRYDQYLKCIQVAIDAVIITLVDSQLLKPSMATCFNIIQFANMLKFINLISWDFSTHQFYHKKWENCEFSTNSFKKNLIK